MFSTQTIYDNHYNVCIWQMSMLMNLAGITCNKIMSRHQTVKENGTKYIL